MEYDFFDVQCEDGSFEAREWTYDDAVKAAKEASEKTGLWYEVHGVKVLARFEAAK
jgi:hypothetical protein